MINKQRVSDGDRIAMLNFLEQTIFSTQDLAVIWDIKSRQTLRVAISRYTKRGLLFKIWKGLYAIVPPQKIHPWTLGQKALNTYAYISCETILFIEGAINQRPREITMVSSVSKRFTILEYTFRVRKMKDELLYNSRGITKKNGVFVANIKRAKKDMYYFNPKKYYDANI